MREYSAAGLAEHPPTVNPELRSVLPALRDRGVPVIMITNTARRAATWKSMLHDRWGLVFDHVIASCEVGKAKPDRAIFERASRLLGLPAAEILHVGDRWELDVVGAQNAGFGAALYRGLWGSYPPGMYPETDPGLVARSGVLCVDRLEELLEDGLLAGPSA